MKSFGIVESDYSNLFYEFVFAYGLDSRIGVVCCLPFKLETSSLCLISLKLVKATAELILDAEAASFFVECVLPHVAESDLQIRSLCLPISPLKKDIIEDVTKLFAKNILRQPMSKKAILRDMRVVSASDMRSRAIILEKLPKKKASIVCHILTRKKSSTLVKSMKFGTFYDSNLIDVAAMRELVFDEESHELLNFCSRMNSCYFHVIFGWKMVPVINASPLGIFPIDASTARASFVFSAELMKKNPLPCVNTDLASCHESLVELRQHLIFNKLTLSFNFEEDCLKEFGRFPDVEKNLFLQKFLSVLIQLAFRETSSREKHDPLHYTAVKIILYIFESKDGL